MKKLILITISLISEIAFSQIKFYPIDAKWIYTTQPCTGELMYDTLISEKDTMVKGMQMRKIKQTNKNVNYLFVISTLGIYRFENDTLRMSFPLNLKTNDTTYIDIRYEGMSTKFHHLKAVCYSVSHAILNKDTIKTYGLNIDLNSTTDASVKQSVNSSVVYTNLSGNLTSYFISTLEPSRPACGGRGLSYFRIDSIIYENQTWSVLTVNSKFPTKISEVDFVSDKQLKIYPNPISNNYVTIEDFDNTIDN